MHSTGGAERPGSTGTDDLAIPGGEDDRGSPACIGTPDRPGVPQRPGSTGADDIATESTAIPYRTIGVAAVAIVAVVFLFSTVVLMCQMHSSLH